MTLEWRSDSLIGALRIVSFHILMILVGFLFRLLLWGLGFRGLEILLLIASLLGVKYKVAWSRWWRKLGGLWWMCVVQVTPSPWVFISVSFLTNMPSSFIGSLSKPFDHVDRWFVRVCSDSWFLECVWIPRNCWSNYTYLLLSQSSWLVLLTTVIVCISQLIL